MANTSESWPKVILTALLLPAVLIFLGVYYIPTTIEASNKKEAVRTARLNKSLEVATHEMEFTAKLNGLKTMMHTFNRQNIRGNLTPSELKGARMRFQKEYTDQYLALDQMAWWWYWDLEKQAQAFDLLSPDEISTMNGYVKAYAENIKGCVNALHPSWSYLSSSKYKLNKISENRFEALEAQMDSDLTGLYNTRGPLIKKISMLFAKSVYEPKPHR